MRTRGDGEQVVADRLAGLSVFEIVVRFADEISDLSARDRIIEVDTGLVHNIRHVMDPDNRGREFKITTETGKPKG
jgi:head-tail adaptor